MVWQRMIQRLQRRNRRPISAHTSGKGRRSLRLESLAKRELLASDLGAVSGVSYADLTLDGLTADDVRLAGVTVELYRDVDASGSLTAGDGAPIATTTSDANGLYFFRGLDVDTFIVNQLSAGSDLVAPDPIVVNIADDSGAVLTVIDDFTETAQMVTVDGMATTASDSAAASEALGGFRDLLVTRTSNVGILNVAADPVDDILSIGSQTNGEGTLLIQYDGDDDSSTLDFTGLGGISLVGGDPGDPVDPDAGILIQASTEATGDTMTVRVYTDENNFAVASNIPVPLDTMVNGVQEDVFVRYASDFVFTGNPDFNNVGAIEFEITISDNNDGTFAAFTVRGPNVETRNLPNEQLLQLGGSLFDDMGGGAETNNGIFDASESGVENITVELYGEPTGGGTIDPSTQTPIATTTTDVNGDYSFDQLIAGDYLVVIPESEFASGETLFGYTSSTGNAPTPDPNDDVDNDNNGNMVAGIGVVSGTISLVAGSEPIDDGDTDPNSNFTLDLGVTPTIDLDITKTLDEAASTLESGGQAFFDLDFENLGPLDANNVVLTDLLPDGMTINEADSDFGTFTPTITGQTISIDLGSLAMGASGTVRIAADIAVGQTAAITNTASITADELDVDAVNNDDAVLVTLANSDLVITKSDNTDSAVIAGEQFTYTITVTNDGPDDARGILATDDLPDDLTFVSASFTTGSGTVTEDPQDSGSLSISIDDLAADESAVIDVIVLVSANATDTLQNTVTVVVDPETDPDLTNNTATEETPVARNVDVSVVKTTSDVALAGGQLVYTIDVTNSGPGDARGVEVTDTLDAFYTFDSLDAGTSGVTVTENGQLLTFDVGTVASGATTTFTFTVDIAASATGTINNQADVTTTDNDTDTTNNSDDVDSTIGTDTDLVLTKEVDLTTAVAGEDTLTYTFTISHDTDSMSDSGEVTFTDTLPAGVTGVTIDAPDATSSGFDTGMQTVTVVFAPIALGQTRTFTVTASVNEDATGTITNTGSISVNGGDSDTTNNSDSAATDLTSEFDVTLTKTANDTTPDPGSNVTYTIDLTNDGPSTATGVVLTDVVPDGLTFVSGTLNGQSATLSGTTVTFPTISLDADETLSATLIFTVDVDTNGTVTNTASVTADAGETDTTNNSASADITASALADLTVTKSVDETEIQAGGELTYTITVTNSGVSTAVDATAVDTLPTGVTFVSGTGPNNQALTANNGVVTVDGGDLAENESFTFTIIASVNATATGTLTNSVSVSTTTDESNENNNTATAATTIDTISSSFGGSVYIDANDNGIRDTDEEGIEGVTLVLIGTDSLGNAVNLAATTDDNGDYVFNDLAAGTYRVDELQPAGFRDGQDTAGTGATATVLNDAFVDIALEADTDAVDFNFGELLDQLSKRRFLAST
ncbi:SpaA isopeptide-forming pilin-related protein [Stieleria sp. TO1_6]|uniref:SdrD B-like domain-containing protein n=1 Tax=Stieleria tagensis TaxID=2956795 RepID=UPI00209AD9D3|nr:SdrD B-like domain-containing protein [Stieleria tagensis]MCO8120459.1 SpaA isopeptide-forming pilin-related protein [Stieleria tagensis]